MGISRWMGESSPMDKHQGALRGSPFPLAGTLFVMAFSLAAGLLLPISKAAAQEAAPAASSESQVKLVQPAGPGQATPPITITLQDALDRARKNDPTFLGAVLRREKRA